jgi:alkylation response protein AidB-like acyl-CoA dehydrogenase
MSKRSLEDVPGLTPDERRFLAEVRAFLRAHWPPEVRATQFHADRVRPGVHPAVRAWFDALAASGWSVPHWPVAHGGTGWSEAKLYLWSRELALAGAPAPDHAATQWAGPALCAWGDAAQQARFLPGIRAARERWCLGIVGPDPGEDPEDTGIRAHRTPAGGYRVEGRKAWVAGAAEARFMLTLARTGAADAEPAGEFSLLVVDLAAPGVTVEPLHLLDGTAGICRAHFARVRLAAVAVPENQRIGPDGGGADLVRALAAAAARHPEPAAALRLLAAVLVDAAAQLPGDEGTLLADAAFARKLAELGVDLAGLEALEVRYLLERSRARGASAPDRDSRFREGSLNRDLEIAPTAVLELRHRAIARRLGELFVEAFGYYSLPDPDPRAVDNEGPIGHEYALAALQGLRASRSLIVDGGSDDALRDHIARQLLES